MSKYSDIVRSLPEEEQIKAPDDDTDEEIEVLYQHHHIIIK